MLAFLFSILTQALTFIPLAVGISVSYHILRATDMTIDGSFVTGAAVFARLVSTGFSPGLAAIAALLCGALAGAMAAMIQRGGRIDPLLAGVLATFILSSVNLVIMGKPNISLLEQHTLVSSAFAYSDFSGWLLVALYTGFFCGVTYLILKSRFGLNLRAFGDNTILFERMGRNVEFYRLAGFAFTNMLAAAAGMITAQTVGYADTGMGFGMTLTGIGAIILGQQVLRRVNKKSLFRAGAELCACLCGVMIYFLALNLLLRLDFNLVYLKMILGIMLILFLRAAIKPQAGKLS
jgi:putative ABC transport system permease protein